MAKVQDLWLGLSTLIISIGILLTLYFLAKKQGEELCEEGRLVFGKTLRTEDHSGVQTVVYSYEVASITYLGARTIDIGVQVPNGQYLVVYHQQKPELSYMLFEYEKEADQQNSDSIQIDCRYIDVGDITKPFPDHLR